MSFMRKVTELREKNWSMRFAETRFLWLFSALVLLLVSCGGGTEDNNETAEAAPLFPPPSRIVIKHEPENNTDVNFNPHMELYPGSSDYEYFYRAMCDRVPEGGTVPYTGEWENTGDIRSYRDFISFEYLTDEFTSSVVYEPRGPALYLDANEPDKPHYCIYIVFPMSDVAVDAVVVTWYDKNEFSDVNEMSKHSHLTSFGILDTSRNRELRDRIKELCLPD